MSNFDKSIRTTDQLRRIFAPLEKLLFGAFWLVFGSSFPPSLQVVAPGTRNRTIAKAL